MQDIVIIGAGPSGVALAHTLKHKLGFNDFIIYEKLDGPGGTWRTNTYPGVGCDIPTILYSFSFNQNPHWSKELCEGPEILNYLESTVDKYSLREHMRFGVECISATWHQSGHWQIAFRDLVTGVEFSKNATVFVSAVGGISNPRDIRFPGMDKFQGPIFHTARWNHSYNWSGKRMAVIGNGCSAAQVIPAIATDAKYVKQYARSAQWYHERPNRNFTPFERWCFRWIPGWQRWIRFSLFQKNDGLVATYMPGEKAARIRADAEEGAREYIRSTAPKEYLDFLIPDFPLGCKRRIFDPGYLESLCRPNVDLVPLGIHSFDETGVTSSDGVKTEFDAIVLATGFDVQQFLVPMEIRGKDGKLLSKQWEENRGAQAYMGTYVHNFPNFAMLFGPNTFPAHNSVLFASEVQVDYIARTMIAPLIDQRAQIVEVNEHAEHRWVNNVHKQLSGTVWTAGCSNWYINKNGRNSATWPGYAASYWLETLMRRKGVFAKTNSSPAWALNMIKRWIKTTTAKEYSAVLLLLLAACYKLDPSLHSWTSKFSGSFSNLVG